MEKNGQDKPDLKKVALPTNQGIVFKNIEDIIYCKAKGRFSVIYINDGLPIVTSRLLKQIEKSVPENKFFRCHRCLLVNTDYISALLKKGFNKAFLKNGISLDVSVRKMKKLERTMIEKFNYRKN